MNLLLHNTDDFIDKISEGHISIGNGILVPTPMGNQMFQMTFPEYCDKICERDNIDKLSLYRKIQHGINRGCLRKLNRSSAFHDKLQEAMDGCVTGGCVTDLFEDRVKRPFKTSYYHTEKDRYDSLRDQLSTMESGMDADNVSLSDISYLQNECNDSLANLRKQSSILQENMDEYEPSHSQVWHDLSMEPHSFYKQSLSNMPDQHSRYGDKQLRKNIPETIQTIYLNGRDISRCLQKENQSLQQCISSIIGNDEYEGLQQMDAQLRRLSHVIPKDTGFMGFLQNLITPSHDTDDDQQDDGADESYDDQQDDDAAEDDAEDDAGDDAQDDEQSDEDQPEDDLVDRLTKKATDNHTKQGAKGSSGEWNEALNTQLTRGKKKQKGGEEYFLSCPSNTSNNSSFF